MMRVPVVNDLMRDYTIFAWKKNRELHICMMTKAAWLSVLLIIFNEV
ncbi:hypothetical protein [Wielerella bovis]|nr:hypothetical protein [Wielerella bovis]MCG7657873.1 hypothetical protein [Wielerella bovis]MCG7660095.1 hypothetical protein [Wielerella bovis]ULJ62313.1 hypothetical protein MIS46_10200 [Wielerella bovis]